MDSKPPGGQNPLVAKAKPKKARLLYERRVNLYSLLLALPGILVSGIFIWLQPWTLGSKLILCFVQLFACWLLAMALQEQVTRPLQTLANVLAALREEDYSFRARGAAADDALGELSMEVNGLADLLADRRISAIEATALLRRVVEEVEVPLFAFDRDQVLRLVNSAGEKLLQQPSVRLLGRNAREIGLSSCLTAPREALIQMPSSPTARWLVRRSIFRQKGLPHTLVVLSDVSRALREEERTAWQRLIRVLGHELNNSMAPIKSIAGSLSARVSEMEMSAEQKHDFERGLAIIETRAASLNRFLQAYRKLAQMPPPSLRKVSLSPIVDRVAGLETRVRVTVIAGPEAELMLDSDQFEQMLINLVKNAADATLESGQADPQVDVRWEIADKELVLNVEDNGPGLLNPGNVFVPFYTTKPGGSGIGLVLSRQIVETHGGSIELMNRSGTRGCRVKVVLPGVQLSAGAKNTSTVSSSSIS
jgi:two-component system, NtrC family, nitrogen regulation sensor histidine kinase NtrY